MSTSRSDFLDACLLLVRPPDVIIVTHDACLLCATVHSGLINKQKSDARTLFVTSSLIIFSAVSESGKCGLYSRLIACARDVIASFSILSSACPQISGRLARVTTSRSGIDYACFACTVWTHFPLVEDKCKFNDTCLASGLFESCFIEFLFRKIQIVLSDESSRINECWRWMSEPTQKIHSKENYFRLIQTYVHRVLFAQRIDWKNSRRQLLFWVCPPEGLKGLRIALKNKFFVLTGTIFCISLLCA